jgi:hypothetical protein
MNKSKFLLFGIVMLLVSSCGNYATKKNAVGWKTLFNGKNLDGWTAKIHHHEVGENFANTFSVKDGSILVSYSGYGPFNEQYGHLFYKESFSSYHLKFEYRFTQEWLKDAPSYTYRNSGVMFHSQDPKTILKEQDWPISVEYQILAEEKPGVVRPTGNMCSPGTDVIFEGDEVDRRHCINSISATIPWNEWVKADLIVYRDSLVIHKVNGETVLKYSKPKIGGGVTNGYDTTIKIDGKALTEGYIGLQSEGQGVEFREIKIKEF